IDVRRRRFPVPGPRHAPPVRRQQRAAERRKSQDAVDEGARPHETDPLPIASRGDIDFSGVTRRSPTDHCTPHPNPLPQGERELTERSIYPLPLWEREGPIAQRWEGEG